MLFAQFINYLIIITLYCIRKILITLRVNKNVTITISLSIYVKVHIDIVTRRCVIMSIDKDFMILFGTFPLMTKKTRIECNWSNCIIHQTRGLFRKDLEIVHYRFVESICKVLPALAVISIPWCFNIAGNWSLED